MKTTCPVYADKDAKCEAGCKGVVSDCRFSGSTDSACTCASGAKTAGSYCSDFSCLTKCDTPKSFFYCKAAEWIYQ